MEHIELGNAGETMAVNLLKNKGHRIIETNYRTKRGELDIISYSGDKVVITEVKTRHSDCLSAPFMAVNRSKQRQIIKLTNQYILDRNLEEEIQFDVISIVLNSKQRRIEHIENAFYPLI